MNLNDLPSSVCQSDVQDYGFWPDEISSAIQAQTTTEQQGADSYIPFFDNLDLGAYNEPYSVSDFSDPIANWDGQAVPTAHDVTGIASAQEETFR
jgi:hypothetical protein